MHLDRHRLFQEMPPHMAKPGGTFSFPIEVTPAR